MNRYCHTKTANRGFKRSRRSGGRGGHTAKVADNDGKGQQRRTRRKTKTRPEASWNKTLGVNCSRFSVERSLKHSGLFWLNPAIDGRHNISALQIEFHLFASLLETTSTAKNHDQTWSSDGHDDGLCGHGLDQQRPSAASGWGHSLHGAELHVEPEVSSRRRQPMRLRMGSGRLRKLPLHQGSGRHLRRQAHEVRDLRWGIDVLQLQPLHRLFHQDIRLLRWQTLHLVEEEELAGTFCLIIMNLFSPKSNTPLTRDTHSNCVLCTHTHNNYVHTLYGR